MRLLLFSNSTNAGEEYLNYTLPFIRNFLHGEKVQAAFIPYAGISVGFDVYYEMVASKISDTGIHLEPVHRSSSPNELIAESELIIVGGGNTFYLLKSLQDMNLLSAIAEKVKKGTPYIGWSAGSNLACPSIKTTNDMPIVQPKDFRGLNLIPFQINPHFTDFRQEGHAGETREMRINEFLLANPEVVVAGLREGTLLAVEDQKIELKGKKSCRIFKSGQDAYEVQPGENLSFLLQ